MNIQYQIRVRAITPRGEFVGTFGDIDQNQDEIENIRGLIFGTQINNIQYIGINLDDGRGTAILNQAIIKDSVFITKVVSVLHKPDN